MPNLVRKNQSAYVNSRFIIEGGGFILYNLEIMDSLQIEGILMAIDIENVFDSVNCFFLNICSKTIRFWR